VYRPPGGDSRGRFGHSAIPVHDLPFLGRAVTHPTAGAFPAGDRARWTQPMARSKVRIRFTKGGDLRLVSHHDLMRCFERMLRRAGLPFHSSEGFNPKPRMVFALSLGLGIVGCDEIVELELKEEIPATEVYERLARQAPPGMEIKSAETVPLKGGARVRGACYRIAVPADRRAAVPERITSLLAAPECWVERTRPQPRRVDIRPYLRDLRLADGALEMDLGVTPTGSARPDEVLGLLGLGDLLEAGAVLERTTLELDNHRVADPVPVPAEEDVRQIPAEPLLPGPLSFDS
jgi:radical SAM-linked protein